MRTTEAKDVRPSDVDWSAGALGEALGLKLHVTGSQVCSAHGLQVCPPQWLAPGQPAGRGEAPHNSYRWIDFLGTDLFLLRRSLNQEKLRVCPLGKDDSKTEWGASGEPGTSFLRTSRDRDRWGAPLAGGGSRAWKSQQGLEGKINWTVKKQP